MMADSHAAGAHGSDVTRRDFLEYAAAGGAAIFGAALAADLVLSMNPAKDVLALNPDGVFLSNGPGDPEPCDYAIAAIREILETRLPVFGICLGHQLLGLATGAKTSKMKFGHHGANHPVQDLDSGRVMITSQNHGFALDADSLDAEAVEVTHLNLNDRTVAALAHRRLPVFGVQYHPEASPGPHDADHHFGRFAALMAQRRP